MEVLFAVVGAGLLFACGFAWVMARAAAIGDRMWDEAREDSRNDRRAA